MHTGIVPANDYGDSDPDDNWDGDSYGSAWECPSLPYYKRLRAGKIELRRETEKAYLFVKKDDPLMGFWIPKKILKPNGKWLYVWIGFQIKWIYVHA